MTFTVYFKLSLCAACSVAGISNALAACRPEGGPLPPARIEEFLLNPEIILRTDAASERSARELRISVLRYAAAGPALIRAMKTILPGATPEQKAAIGEGLFGAVLLCMATDPAMAGQIEAAIKLISDRDVMESFRLAKNLAAHPLGGLQPQSGSGFTRARKAAPARGLIEEPTPAGPGSLKLANPFGRFDAWR